MQVRINYISWYKKINDEETSEITKTKRLEHGHKRNASDGNGNQRIPREVLLGHLERRDPLLDWTHKETQGGR